MSKKTPKPTRGKATNLYLHEGDLMHIRKLGGWLMQTHGYRVSDSQVIRAAVHLAAPGDALAKAFVDVMAADARRKRSE